MPRRRGGSLRRRRPEGAMSTCNLPNAVIADILSRLLVKSLLRFRCVCKPWRTLFANPRFISMHHSRTKNDETLLVQSRNAASADHVISLLHTKNPDFAANLDHPFPPHFLLYDMEVVGSINGLVCLSSPPLSPLITLWNPATKQYKYLPLPIVLNFCTNTVDKVSIGFAFDSVGNDYKIIRIVCFKHELSIPTRAEVYSANGGSWREIEIPPFHFFEPECAAVVKGVPYWMACPQYELGYSQLFVWFDAGNDLFRQSPMPGIAAHDKTQCRPANFKDSLAVLVYSSGRVPFPLGGFQGLFYCPVEDSNKCVDVWMMEDSGGGDRSWSKKYTFGPILGVERLVGCSKNGEIVVENREGVLLLYDPDTEEVENVQINGAQAESFVVCSYSESLVSIRESIQVGKLHKKFTEQFDKQDRKNRYR